MLPDGDVKPTQTPHVVCQIQHHTYPNPSHNCQDAGPTGGALGISAGGTAEWECIGDAESGGPTLAYGKSLEVSGLACVSRRDGVTCKDVNTGAGFRLASASYDIFTPGHTTGATAPAATGSSMNKFAGTWGGHGRALVFGTTGVGKVSYRSYVWCSDNPNPPCDSIKNNQIVAGGKITVTLTSASPQGSAYVGTGSITSSNDPQHAVNTAVTATVSGYNLTLSIWPDAPFCAANTPPNKWNCGA
jgi:hypothetical protein